MNYSMVLRLLGYVLLVEAVLLLLPLIVALLYGEMWVAQMFLITVILCAGIGFLLTRIKAKKKVFYMREGFVITALSWIVISIMGAVPFVLTGSIPNPVDAVFETVSGFTTTGASILPAVEGLSHGILFWRSFTHWVGGMGVLVFLLSLLPLTGGSHMNLMKAESPGPQVDKLVPKVQSTAKILYGIYMGLTIIEIIVLVIGKMPLFDAVTAAFGTAGTGGFGIKNDSITSYSNYIQNTITVFMILFGVNFNAYFLILLKKFKKAGMMEEVRGYLAVIVIAIILITWDVRGLYGSLGEALRLTSFQVGSIITTTGYSTADFNAWPGLSRTILVMLMFIGACAGSTGGGIKVSRVIILCKTIKKEIKQMIHPKILAPVRMDGKMVPHETVRSTNVYMAIYILIFAFSVMLISLDGQDMVTNFTAVAATLNNIGPGLEIVGPTGNFAVFSAPVKLILIFDMLAGRLELFPMLVLFYRGTWKRF